MIAGFDPGDPRHLAIAGGVAVAVLAFLLILTLVRAGRASRALGHVARLNRELAALAEAQQRIAGGLGQVAESGAAGQVATEARLSEVGRQMGESLGLSAARTAEALGALHARLAAVDAAQAKIEALSGNVLGLQEILANKQTRGAFGEIQLYDIVSRALPADAFRMQATLSNGRRADCLIDLPEPPGPIAVDAKFPLEGYEALVAAKTPAETEAAARAFRTALRTHIRAISERYVIEGETAEGALMFLPSEAVHAELHARFPEVVREGFAAKVWIVSPTTCMATLTAMRAVLKDARLAAHAGEIRAALALLMRDVELVAERAARLETHFSRARADLDGIGVAAERAGRRAARIEAMDFGEGLAAAAE